MPLDPDEAAARWHVRLCDGEDARAAIEFERWRSADAEHAAAYDRLSDRQDELRALGDAPEILSLRQQTLARLALKRPARLRAGHVLSVILAVLMVGGPIYALYRSGASAPREMADARGKTAGQLFSTAVGQRMTLTLGDGSRVMLNTASRMRVAYTNSERRLVLEDGQAWFEVAKHKPRPFVVFAGGQRVEAHGTAFDVRIRPDRTEVMLAEGKVTVGPGRDDGTGASVAMSPSELLVASASGTSLRRVTDPGAWRNWREGIVTFDNTPLSAAIAEMNRYSETQLAVADPGTGRIAVSGAFHAGAMQAFVEALAMGFRVEGHAVGKDRIVLQRIP